MKNQTSTRFSIGNSIVLVFAFILLSGCASNQLTPIFKAQDIGLERGTTNKGSDRLKEVDLAKLIDKDATDMDQALRIFRLRCTTGGCQGERNAIQDRLIAASNAICREYKSDLKQAHANTNLQFGGASTILGGLGALTQSVNPARLFAGSASIASGLRAEINQNLYAMLAVEVITKAIDKARAEVLRDIDANQKSVLGNYTLERAIADSVEYHARCSLLAGLQEASTAVSQAENIGLKALGRTLTELGIETQLPLGKKNFQLNASETLMMRTVCANANARFANFVQDKQIVSIRPDFSSTIQDWRNLYEGANYCRNLNKTGDVAAEFDAKWQALFDEFSKQTDDKERERILGQIAGQQAGAKAVATALTASLESTLRDLQAARTKLDQAKEALQLLNDVTLPINRLAQEASETNKGEKLTELARFRNICTSALERLKATKSDITAEHRTAIESVLKEISALTIKDDFSRINATVDKLTKTLIAPLSGLSL